MDLTRMFSDLSPAELMILGWQMALFLITISILVILGRKRLSLIATYLFTLFWGFYFYWGSYLSSSSASLLPVALYAFCGLLHVVLTALSFYQEDRKASTAQEMT